MAGADPAPVHPSEGELLRRLRRAASEGCCSDMVIIGDFGKDQDDEKALAVAVALRRLGLIGELAVVANLSPALMRARLAKGTLGALGCPEVPVAAGTDGGSPGEECHAYEFDCPYLAAEGELCLQGGHELFFEALDASRRRGRRACIALNSSLTDMAACLKDPRWAEWGRATVAAVTVQGGVRDEGGRLVMDPAAANSAFDLASAAAVYSQLRQEAAAGGPRFVVASRHAAVAAQVPRGAVSGSAHPVARRLAASARRSLQLLWQRVHRSEPERREAGDALPLRCDPAWYRAAFLSPEAPAGLTAADEVWEHIRGFNEYDGLATVAAALSPHDGVFGELFTPRLSAEGGTAAVGLSAEDHGLRDPGGAALLLHELLTLAFARSPQP
eukprot:TRINITY_DN55966_c0_g1_i1.p2 TRINITY_DN55966_c0_g1~~TRINITY_DN55966_c0_g1_i1.p2  ORF type:complete len:387 (+),score=98.65 TRINITY_DN55966_c0_g1_i1:80-1240(+)